MPVPGTIFRLKGDTFHRWIVISNPKDGKVLCVSVTDEEKCPDSPCKIGVGEHLSITKPSAVSYRHAREFGAYAIDQEIASGINVDSWPNCSTELVEKIVAGANIADDLTARFLDYL